MVFNVGKNDEVVTFGSNSPRVSVEDVLLFQGVRDAHHARLGVTYVLFGSHSLFLSHFFTSFSSSSSSSCSSSHSHTYTLFQLFCFKLILLFSSFQRERERERLLTLCFLSIIMYSVGEKEEYLLHSKFSPWL